jgi:pimeloyl-ACP methyl ester carboxylesterase/DNA-binding winged helix-turn-helix (wHTH) protein
MRFSFDDCTLDTDTLELFAGGAPVGIEPQVFSVLVYLLSNRDRVVTKEELLDGVWGDRFVSESALTTRIKQARQAVGDSGQEQRVIKTVHGRGYRFVAEVTEATTAEGTRAPEQDGALPTVIAVTSVPRTRYAEGEGASIAYQTFGEGPDLVLIAGFATNVEVQWEHPDIAAFLRRLGSFSRVTVLDKRGVGLSDRMPHDDPPSLETRADDLSAVMDAADIERATILGSSEGGSLSVVFTASHPERVERLVLHSTWLRHPDRPLDPAKIERAWGDGHVYRRLGPSLGRDAAGQHFLARYERQSATPRAARLLRELSGRFDVTSAAAAISVPTLILHRRDDVSVPFADGEALAAQIPGSRLVALEGRDHYLFSGDAGPLLDAIEAFVEATPSARSIDRVLATVLFVDIVGSTKTAGELGDARWAALLDDFEQSSRRTIDDHRGQLVKTTGDGLVATFDGPGRGVEAAAAIRAAVAPLGLTIRCGLHTAEIERRGDDIAGIGVHIASRVADAAGPSEIWVSRTVTDLVAGTGLTFAERGTFELRGLDHPWALFAAEL